MVDQLQDTHDHLSRAVEAVVSGADWQRMLSVASRFHIYSPTNSLMIAAQFPTASHIGGYQFWRTLGRQVRAGEHGIRILAPVTCRTTTDDTTGPDGDTPPTTDNATTARKVRGFRLVSVFDISQTDGPDFPEVAPVLLDGDAPDDGWAQIERLIVAAGFTVSRGWCQGANGYTDHAAREVKVRADISPLAALRTLTHELAHVRLHARIESVSALDRCRMEVEAESVAFLVMAAMGVDAGAYSFAYVARWSRGDLDRIRTTATTAINCARQLITELAAVEATGEARAEADSNPQTDTAAGVRTAA